jgi:hypothetical protein
MADIGMELGGGAWFLRRGPCSYTDGHVLLSQGISSDGGRVALSEGAEPQDEFAGIWVFDFYHCWVRELGQNSLNG